MNIRDEETARYDHLRIYLERLERDGLHFSIDLDYYEIVPGKGEKPVAIIINSDEPATWGMSVTHWSFTKDREWAVIARNFSAPSKVLTFRYRSSVESATVAGIVVQTFWILRYVDASAIQDVLPLLV